MNCDAAQDLLFDYANGALDAAEAKILQHHLASGCPQCEGRLAEAKATLGLLPLALDPVEPPVQVREKLLARLSASVALPQTGPSKFVATRAKPFWWIGPATAGAAVAAGLLLTLGLNIIMHKQKSIDLLETKATGQQVEITQLRSALEESRGTQRLIESPAVQIVALAGTSAQPGAQGRLLWDGSSGTFRFFGADMRNLPAGRAYELWLINAAQEKVAAGMMTPGADGQAVLSRVLSTPVGVLVATAVTDEPAGGSRQPTGSIQLLGKFN